MYVLCRCTEQIRSPLFSCSSFSLRQEGFNALARMYREVQEPLERASDDALSGPDRARAAGVAAAAAPAPAPAETAAFPNPWAAPAAAPANPLAAMMGGGLGGGPSGAPNPFAAMLGGGFPASATASAPQTAGFAGTGASGANPFSAALEEVMRNPAMLQEVCVRALPRVALIAATWPP